MSEIRYDLIHNEYVLIAPERLHRPIELATPKNSNPSNCPFCPGNEDMTTKEIFSIKVNGKWITRVIPNLYKAVAIENNFNFDTDGINEKFGGFGAHEIIIDTPKHNANFNTLNEDEIFYYLKTIKQRIIDLKKDKRIIFLNIFKNKGIKAGASQPHPHTQIIGLPLMTNFQKKLFKRSYEFYKTHGKSLYEEVFLFESKNKRKIYNSDEFLTYTPFASSFAFENIIMSKNFASIENMDDTVLKELSIHIKKLFSALNTELGEMDFNMLFYLPPINKNFENEDYFDEVNNIFRFFIRVTPRIYNLAGFELMSSSAINPVVPEEVAKLLREKI